MARSRVSCQIAMLLGLGLCGLGGWALQASSAISAEQVTTMIAGKKINVPIQDLEQFAKSGVISPAFAPLATQLGEPTLTQLRALLLKQFPMGDPAEFDRLLATPLMRPLLRSMGQVLLSPMADSPIDEADIRKAMVAAAAAPDGLTLLDVLQQFPGETVQLDVKKLITLVAELTMLTNYREAAVEAIRQESEQEVAATTMPQFTAGNLSQPGLSKVTVRSRQFTIKAYRPTAAGEADRYTMPVDFYLPQGRSSPTPLVIFSHGFGANRDAYAYLANHLASHGIAVATPEHLGSDLQYRKVFLEGDLEDLVLPGEILSRSLDITYLLDELAKDAELAGTLDLNRVGVTGNSLGATTALSVAGASFNFARLRHDCNDDRLVVSPSFLVQCIGQKAALSAMVNLGDRRVKAVLAAYPLTSSIFGPEGMAQLTVPTMLIAGSQDVMAPPVQDQIHPFLWLKMPNKYLLLMEPGTHFSTSLEANVAGFPPQIVGSGLDAGRSYLQAMSVAFFTTYLSAAPDRSPYLPYLSAAYAKSISRNPLQLHLIQSLTSAQLEQAYGTKPPSPIIPPPIATR